MHRLGRMALTAEQARRLTLIRNTLDRAESFRRESESDRVAAILLAAQAAEMMLVVARGREVSQAGAAIREVEDQFGVLGSRSGGEAMFKARVRVQHSGVVPDTSEMTAQSKPPERGAANRVAVTVPYCVSSARRHGNAALRAVCWSACAGDPDRLRTPLVATSIG